jgi:hypothetical protein
MLRARQVGLLGLTLLTLGTSALAQSWGTVRYGIQVPPLLSTHIYQVNPCHPSLVLQGNAPSETPAGDVDYADMPILVGTGITVELWAGATADPLGMGAVDKSRVNLRNGSSGFLPFSLSVPGWKPGDRPYFQLRAWNNQGGSIDSYAEALSRDAGIGYSAVFQSEPLGGTTPEGPVLLTPILSGLRSFNLWLLGDLTPTVSFDNAPGSAWGSEGPVYDTDGTTPLSGEGYVAALYVGKSSEPDASWVPVRMDPSGFGTGAQAGYWHGRQVAVGWFETGIYQRTCLPGTNWFEARVWERAFGAAYEEARIKGGKTGTSGRVPWVYAFDAGGAHAVSSPWPSFSLVQNTPFRITSTRLRSASEIEIRLSGPSSTDCVLEASADLATWTPVSTNLFVGGAVTFTDSVSLDRPRRMYRAKVCPNP